MLDKIRSFIHNNQQACLMATLCAAFITITVVCSGCDLQKMVKVDTPRAVVIATAVSPEDVDREITLAEAQDTWDDWVQYVESNTDRFRRAIDDAEDRFVKISSLVDLGLSSAQAPIAGLPGGAVILSALTGLTGLFLRRPGDADRLAKEKRDSYNAGIEIGAKMTAEASKPDSNKVA
jgi:hypothetical protein